MIVTLILLGLAVLALGGFIGQVWLGQRRQQEDLAVLAAQILELQSGLGLAGTGEPAAPSRGDTAEQIRQRWQGIAPAMPMASMIPPVDTTIPTSASIPRDDPGDRDVMEVEETPAPLSPEPPGR